MIKLGGLIGLKPLNEADVFTATNKETGNVSVFKSKAARDAAVDAGSHEMRKDDKEDSVDVKGIDDKPKVNIFNKDKKEPKSDKPSTGSSSSDKIPSQEDLDSELDSLLKSKDMDGLKKFLDGLIDLQKRADEPESRIELAASAYNRAIKTLSDPKSTKKQVKDTLSMLKDRPRLAVAGVLEKQAEDRAVKKGWTPRKVKDEDGFSMVDPEYKNKKPKGNPADMLPKEELVKKVDELTGEELEDFVLKEIVPYIENDMLLNTLFIQLNGPRKNDPDFEKLVKDNIRDAVKEIGSAPPAPKTDAEKEIENMDSYETSDYIEKNKDKFSKQQQQQLADLEREIELVSNEEYNAEDEDEREALENKRWDLTMKMHDIIKSTLKKGKNESSTKLMNLLPEQETFTATSKETGKTSVFKSKASRDAAVKAGTHTMKKDGTVKDTSKKDKSKANIFSKGKAEPKPETNIGDRHDIDDMSKPFTVFKDMGRGRSNVERDFENIEDAQTYADRIGGEVKKKSHEKGRLGKTVKTLVSVPDSELPKPKSNKYRGNLDDMKIDMQNAFEDGYTGKGLVSVKSAKGGFQVNMASYMNDNSFKDVLDAFNKTNGTNFVAGDVEKTPYGTRVVISEPKDEPKSSEPKTDIPAVKPRPADKVLVKTVDKYSKKYGLSPEKLGKEEYEKHMLSYIHDALEDANFHSANRQIFADLQGRPELAKRPDYSTAPEIGTPEREEWDMKNSIYNKNFDASVTEFDGSDEAVGALTSQASWEGERIIDSLLDKLRKDGSGELADKIQISFDKDMAKNESSTKLGNLLPEETLNEGPSTEEKRIAMLAVRKQAKFRSVSLEQAIQDQINALEDLMRDSKRGKLK